MSLEKQLKSSSIQPTAMRKLVLKAFVEKDTSLSLNELEKILPHADKSSIYRTLKLFERNNLVHLIDDGTGRQKYGLCKENCTSAKDHQHFHFTCELCNETFCFPEISIPPVLLPAGFTIKEANLVLKGCCNQCQ